MSGANVVGALGCMAVGRGINISVSLALDGVVGTGEDARATCTCMLYRQRHSAFFNRNARRATGGLRHWGTLSAAFLLLTGTRHAEAQEALRSALSLDRIEQSRQAAAEASPISAPAPHIGPVQMDLGVYASGQYNDNVNNADKGGALSDEIIETGMIAGFTWPATPQSSLYLNAGVGYLKYLNHPKYDRLQLAPNSVLNWNVGLEDVTLSFYDQFTYSQQVVSEAALAGSASFPLFDNTVGTRATWTPGKWDLSAGYSHDNYVSDSSAYQYLNRSSEYIFARVGRRFAEKTEAGVEGTVSVTSYDLALQNGSTSYSGGVFVEWQLTQWAQFTARGGPTIYDFQSSGRGPSQSALTSYYASAQLHHSLTEFISHQIGVDRSVELGYNLGSAYLQQLAISYSLSWQLTRTLTLNPSMSYINGSQPLPEGRRSTTESYDQYSGGLSLGWQATGNLQTSLSYARWDRESNMAGRNYADNMVTLRLAYHF
jgi:hypothetical protein